METENRYYRAICMLPITMEEPAIEEFINKLEAEINNHGGALLSVDKIKHHMVKTSTNKGARGVHLLTVRLSGKPAIVHQLESYLRLAQGLLINYIVLSDIPSEVAA